MTETTDPTVIRDLSTAQTRELEQLRAKVADQDRVLNDRLADINSLSGRLADTESKLRAARSTIGAAWEALPDDYTDTRLSLGEAVGDLASTVQRAKVDGHNLGRRTVLRTLEDIAEHGDADRMDIPTIVATLRAVWEV